MKDKIMISLPVWTVKDLIKAYWWSSDEIKTGQGIPKQIQIMLDGIKETTGEEFDWFGNGTWYLK